ncbi:biopolymer transporter ExbD [Xylophilus sp. GOD-11R]|uniref:ExbD/TolR family protein n=1 Tax=Xylophilus sp. GOD-11R TaxID=3089814 RepID=UPI00298C1AD5|nr:biopolymer transporter ExbD [Xylophilus sp. GOD-11R]WPB57217.1 biopolymer transporter ExbD [Xylophilus sp. GOD-11R]
MAFGRLSRGPDAAPLSEINVTPLVDVMLVLVVVFLLTAPLLATSIRLDLPQAATAPAPSGKQGVQLVVDAAGQAFLDDRPLGDKALAERLAQVAADDPDTEIQLRADTAVPYGRVVALLDLAQQAGLVHVGFVAAQRAATPDRP